MSIPRHVRRRAIKDHIRHLHRSVYFPQCKRNEVMRHEWLEAERDRRAVEMARWLIHSDGDEWQTEFGDEKLLASCPLVAKPFTVHALPDADMVKLIQRSMAMTLQEYRAEQVKKLKAEEEKLKQKREEPQHLEEDQKEAKG